jgi:hypothetical protein
MAGNDSSPRRDREGLERELLERLRTAEKNYRAAVAEYERLQREYGEMLDRSEGARALHLALEEEREAVKQYSRALKIFTDLILRGRLPRASGE